MNLQKSFSESQYFQELTVPGLQVGKTGVLRWFAVCNRITTSKSSWHQVVALCCTVQELYYYKSFVKCVISITCTYGIAIVLNFPHTN
jgi:hypothetical protein